MSTVITLNNHNLRITHEQCSDFGNPSDGVLLVKESQANLNTLSKIEVSNDDVNATVYLHWRQFEGANLGLFLAEETRTLFLGAGTISVTINLQTFELIHENYVTLFWNYQRVGKWIVELGELECYLYDDQGRVIDEAPVDPPYLLKVTEHGIQFESIVHGETFLRFPV